ncbi:hypothetical protein PRIPAC_86111 [Pristionchus pacificus]|uniref:Uncharacterized protein n=1 Tax=Pristionchus pacificus TaxID=54126 RepID=A0A2A6CCA0_PRIPA|nr:hypothetical protein PRIPAC_86111 [Pristionchus pacificus]|eukprot:PDM75855.1 hypothetical protein PRIPAC_40234 [Pristionchus pacificus]
MEKIEQPEAINSCPAEGVVLYEHPKEDRVREPWAERGGEMAAREKGERGPKEGVTQSVREKEDGEREPWAEKEGEKEEQKEVDGGGPAKKGVGLHEPTKGEGKREPRAAEGGKGRKEEKGGAGREGAAGSGQEGGSGGEGRKERGEGGGKDGEKKEEEKKEEEEDAEALEGLTGNIVGAALDKMARTEAQARTGGTTVLHLSTTGPRGEHANYSVLVAGRHSTTASSSIHLDVRGAEVRLSVVRVDASSGAAVRLGDPWELVDATVARALTARIRALAASKRLPSYPLVASAVRFLARRGLRPLVRAAARPEARGSEKWDPFDPPPLSDYNRRKREKTKKDAVVALAYHNEKRHAIRTEAEARGEILSDKEVDLIRREQQRAAERARQEMKEAMKMAKLAETLADTRQLSIPCYRIYRNLTVLLQLNGAGDSKLTSKWRALAQVMSKRVGILRDAIEKVAPRLTPAIAADPTRRRTIRVRYPFIIGVTVADTAFMVKGGAILDGFDPLMTLAEGFGQTIADEYHQIRPNKVVETPDHADDYDEFRGYGIECGGAHSPAGHPCVGVHGDEGVPDLSRIERRHVCERLTGSLDVLCQHPLSSVFYYHQRIETSPSIDPTEDPISPPRSSPTSLPSSHSHYYFRSRFVIIYLSFIHTVPPTSTRGTSQTVYAFPAP